MSDEQKSLSDARDMTIRQQAETIRQQAERLQQLEDQVKRLQALLEGKADAKTAKKPVFKENYSFDRNKNKKKKPKRKSTGRKPTQHKRDLATQVIDIYPEGVTREQCIRQRSQLAWRIVDGKAVYVCYHIYDLPASPRVPVPTGLRNSRSEFGIEIILILASLQTRISNFTLSNVLAEIARWLEAGSSLFQQELQTLHLTLPPPTAAS